MTSMHDMVPTLPAVGPMGGTVSTIYSPTASSAPGIGSGERQPYRPFYCPGISIEVILQVLHSNSCTSTSFAGSTGIHDNPLLLLNRHARSCSARRYYLKLGEYHTPDNHVSQPRHSCRWPTKILALQFLHSGILCAFLLEFSQSVVNVWRGSSLFPLCLRIRITSCHYLQA